MYDIIVCHRCGRLLLSKRDQKTRHCPSCETRVSIKRARVLASASTAREASELIRALKQKRQ